MSYSIGLLYPNELNGIIAFSGRLLEELKPLVKKDDCLQKKIFIAHGVQDKTLPVHYSREAKDYSSGKVTWPGEVPVPTALPEKLKIWTWTII